MRIRSACIVCAMLPWLGSCNAPPPHAGQLTEQGQSMERMLADVNQLRSFVYGSSSPAEADQAAQELLSWSRRMSELFPPGVASADYVDMSPERARGSAEAMVQTSERLLAAVRSGNRSAIGDQLAQTEREGCGSCHLSKTR